jgi:glycosyltransferase involved in cell wall biosynthesis
MKRNELISVVICTYNRADLARQAITSVLAQDFPQTGYELLIIDNNSTDHTGALAQEFCGAYPNVRFFLENKVGLSHARNRGWQEAGGEYVAYIDDDCKVPPSWLKAAANVIEQEHPAAFGGPFYPFYNSPKPAWFKDEYGSHVQGQEMRPLIDREYLDGMNMFIRADALELSGGFDPDFGMKGKKIAYGEETDLIYRLRKQAEKIYYAPEVFVYHLVRSEKMNLWTNLVMSFSGGYYYAKIAKQSKRGNFPGNMFQMLKVVLKIAKSLSWDLLRRDRRVYPFFQNFLYEVSFQLVTDLGYSVGLLSKKNVV